MRPLYQHTERRQTPLRTSVPYDNALAMAHVLDIASRSRHARTELPFCA
jgi:hypothetical protein